MCAIDLVRCVVQTQIAVRRQLNSFCLLIQLDLVSLGSLGLSSQATSIGEAFDDDGKVNCVEACCGGLSNCRTLGRRSSMAPTGYCSPDMFGLTYG